MQFDSCKDVWVPSWGRPSYLLLAVDDYSRTFLHGDIVPEDGAWSTLVFLRQLVERWGVFRELYSDNASWLNVNPMVSRHYQYAGDWEERYTDVELALLDLQILPLHHRPYEPTSKGKVENRFEFLQQRLLHEMDPEDPPEKARRLLARTMNYYNTRHRVRTTGACPVERQTPSVFRPWPEALDPDDVFALRDTRQVDKAHRISFRAKSLKLPNPPGMIVRAGDTVDLRIHPHRKIRVWHKRRFLGELPYPITKR